MNNVNDSLSAIMLLIERGVAQRTIWLLWIVAWQIHPTLKMIAFFALGIIIKSINTSLTYTNQILLTPNGVNCSLTWSLFYSMYCTDTQNSCKLITWFIVYFKPVLV